MEFTREEEKILLQALYRFRGDVSGASQSEQNKYAMVERVIGKIERDAGPLSAERTQFDREMEESLSVLARGGAWPPATGELDKGSSPPKVEARPRVRRASAKKAAAPGRAPVAGRGPAKAKAAAKAPAAKKAKKAGAPKSSGAGSARPKGVRAAKR